MLMQIVTMMEDLDEDGDGVIDFFEFVHMVDRLSSADPVPKATVAPQTVLASSLTAMVD
jgi:hypothetical protein